MSRARSRQYSPRRKALCWGAGRGSFSERETVFTSGSRRAEVSSKAARGLSTRRIPLFRSAGSRPIRARLRSSAFLCRQRYGAVVCGAHVGHRKGQGVPHPRGGFGKSVSCAEHAMTPLWWRHHSGYRRAVVMVPSWLACCPPGEGRTFAGAVDITRR